jgi:hypothetical protein
MTLLKAGDVVRFSAGTTQDGPEGYGLVGPASGLLRASAQKWPGIAAALDGMPMLINAYPTSIGRFDAGVLVDTYLSPRTVARALHLAHLRRLPAVLVSTPLFAADVLLAYAKSERPWPRSLVLVSGGYPMPSSLQAVLREVAGENCRVFSLLHLYGATEADAACMMAVERDDAGELIYHVRGDDVEVRVESGDLLLSVKEPSGAYKVREYKTGDQARRVGAGYAIWNDRRFSREVMTLLTGWNKDIWSRRTGHALRVGNDRLFQLRDGPVVPQSHEMEFYDFWRQSGLGWLQKPVWI